jgi:hypothetical protein
MVKQAKVRPPMPMTTPVSMINAKLSGVRESIRHLAKIIKVADAAMAKYMVRNFHAWSDFVRRELLE